MLQLIGQMLRGRALAALAIFGLASGAAQAVQVTEVPTSPFTVFQASALIGAGQVTRAQFTIPVAGTVTVTLSDLAWPDRLASLSFCLSDGNSVFARLMQAGTFSFELDEPGQFFAFVAGTPLHPSGLGLYALQVSIVPVPLPAAGLLFLSGLVGLALVRRRRAATI